MPLARIDISKNASDELIRIVSEAVYRAIVEVANVPAHDKFQIINRHAADEINEKGGVRKEDVWINLLDTGREDWSFGNGEMQYAPK